MATLKNYEQIKAAYDALLAKKTKAQRAENVQRQQAIMGVNNYLRQNGYTGGAAESILLRARGNAADYSDYDTQLAEYSGLMRAYEAAAGRGGRGRMQKRAVKPSANAGYNRANDRSLVAGKTGGNSNAYLNKYTRMTH